MEPEVHIIEKYFQEILQCFTMTNIRCKGGKEVDLLAVNPKTGEKHHVEARVGTSPGFKIREKDNYTSDGRPHKRGLDYFYKKKFNHPVVIEKIHEMFGDSAYAKVLVVWDVDKLPLIRKAQRDYGINIWFIGDLIESLMKQRAKKGSRDDVLRTLELLSILKKDEETAKRRRMRTSFVLKPDEENPSIRKPDLEKARLSRHQRRLIRKAVPKVGLKY